MRKLLIFIAVLALFTIPLAAQTADSTRNQVLAYYTKGDTASAEKLMLDSTSTQAKSGGNTSQEELRACGFYPQKTRLACTIDIKQDFGFGGPIGTFGSFEYVTFFVDFNNNGFQSSDYVGAGIVNVTDGSLGTSFAVYRDFNPPGGPRTSNGGGTTTTTTTGPIVRAQAKLSWFLPITNPAQPPLFGNDVFFTIRLNPIR